MKHSILVYRKDEQSVACPLVVLLVEPPYTMSGILDHYAKEYGFERKKLVGSMMDVVDLSDIHQ